MDNIPSPLTLLEKFKISIYNVSENEDGTFSDDGVMYHHFKNDPDLPLIEKKVENFLKLMNESNKNGKFQEFLDRNFETDIWFLI